MKYYRPMNRFHDVALDQAIAWLVVNILLAKRHNHRKIEPIT
jgi:hypothetical protein